LYFKQHVTGKPVRHKVRYRTYESTGITFLEVKKKTNRNRTIKWRMENDLTYDNKCDEGARRFIRESVPGAALELLPVLINSFISITLAGAGFAGRATIDFDLSFSDTLGKQIRYPFVSIVELKSEGNRNGSYLADVMKDFYIHPSSLSKYCFGASLLYDIPRRNILKEQQSLFKKLENEYNGYCNI
jgi:hypothetical protein